MAEDEQSIVGSEENTDDDLVVNTRQTEKTPEEHTEGITETLAPAETNSVSPAFINPIYAETLQPSEETEKQEVTGEELVRESPLDRLVRYATADDTSYNSHRALDRLRRRAEDDSGDETSTLIASTDGDPAPTLNTQAPIDRLVAVGRQNPTINTRHPLDRLLLAATQDSGTTPHPIVDRLAAQLQSASDPNPKHPLDRLRGEYPTTLPMQKLYDTALCEDKDIPSASSVKPIDKLMRTALKDTNKGGETLSTPLDRVVAQAKNSESEFDSRKPIDRLTKTLTGGDNYGDITSDASTLLTKPEKIAPSK